MSGIKKRALTRGLITGDEIYLQGILFKGIGGFYYVKADNGLIYECKARGIFRKENIKPTIGDRVVIEIIDDTHANIVSIMERSSYLIRPSVSNVDSLVVVVSVKNPVPDFCFIDKLLVMSEIRGIKPALCINKTDLISPDEIKNNYKNTNYPIFEVCAKNEKINEDFYDFLKDKTTAFAGLSGVGKSSILNLLVKKELKTGNVSDKIQRGKHTTRHVELFELDFGGYVLDTPGFSSFEAETINPKDLDKYFPEMQKFLNQCRFNGCAHINEPDCKVKEALKNDEISQSRYESYKKIYESLKQINKWEL